MLASLQQEHGRMAVVVANGVLFRGAAEGQIRRQLIEENLLDAVIGLPEKLFYGTGISAAILLFKRNKSDDKILFIDASRDYQDGKNQNQLRPQDLQKIGEVYQSRSSVAGYAFLASLEDLAVNEFNLNISRYVHQAENTAEVNFICLRQQRAEIKKQLASLELEMDEHLLRLDLGQQDVVAMQE
jgi:type I restriction enzyme M protein